MAYKDEEEKRRRAQERKAAGEQHKQRREELLEKNAELNADKQAPKTEKLTGGKTKTSASAASVNASAAAYSKKREGDNDMAKVVSSYGKEQPDIAKLSYEDAMSFATRIVYDEERDDFLARWKKAHKDEAPTMDEMRKQLNSVKPGGLYRESKDAYSRQVKENFAAEYDEAMARAEKEKRESREENDKGAGLFSGAKEALEEWLDGLKERKGGAVWNAQGEAYTIEDGKAATIKSEQEPKRTISIGEWQGPKVQEKPEVPSLNEALADEKYMQAFMEKKAAQAKANGEDVGEWQGPQFKSLMQRALEDGEYQAFVRAQMEIPEAEKEAQRPVGTVNLKDNPVSAFMYAYRGDGDLLDKETQAAVNELLAASPEARAIAGLDAQGSMELYAQAEAGDPFAIAKANAARHDYLTGGYVSVLGSRLSRYVDMARGEAWPDELRDDMQGVVLQVAISARDAYERGEFAYDPEKETLCDAYLRLNPQAEDPLKAAQKAVIAMEFERQEAQKLAKAEAEKAEQEKLRQSRLAVESGAYTQEDYERVLAGAPQVTTLSAAGDETYRQMLSEIRTDRTLSDGEQDSWHNQMAARYLKESGKTIDLESAQVMAYKDMLCAFEEDVLLSDMRVAATLGYESLEAMYSKWGGMTLEQMHGRAELAMQALAQSVTPEDAAAIEEANAYEGTGQATYGEAIVEGGKYGVYSTAGDMLEAVWAFDTIAKEDRPSAVANVRSEYVRKYDYALGAAMYEQDMRIYAQNAPSKEQGEAIIAYLDAGYDPFRLGIDPTQSSVIIDAANAMDERADAISAWARKNLDAKQGRVFEVAGATTGTLTMQAVASVGSYAAGSAWLGNFVGYGLVSSAEEMRTQLEGGAARKNAALMGFAHGVSDTWANMASSQKLMEKMQGFVGYAPLVDMGRKAAGDVAATRTALGMFKAFGGGLIRGGTQQLLEEAVADPLKETIGWQAVGSAVQAHIDGAGYIQSIAKGLLAMDVVDAADQMIWDAGVNVISTLPLAFLGGLGEGFKASRIRAAELAASAKAEDAKAFAKALADDLETPQNRDMLNQALHDAAVGQEAAVILMTDEEVAVDIDTAAKAQEQAYAHQAELKASEKRMGAAQTAYYERKNRGDINGANKALANYAKANQGKNEHERERAQKQAEADKGFARGMQEATAQAEASVSAREAAAKASAGAQGRLKEIEAEIETFKQAFDRMKAEDPSATVPQYFIDAVYELVEEQGRLEAQLEAEAAPKIDAAAVSAQRADAENAFAQKEQEQTAQEAAYQQKVMAQQEADEMKPVYQTLSRTQVYVDESQKANILARTGLKSLAQVNRKYGLKLTSDKSKGVTSLDGSFFAELTDLAPGRIEQDVTVAEDALMDIVERKKQLKGMQASVGETVYEQYLPDGVFYNIQDPVMQQMTSDVSKRTGVQIVVAPLAGNIRAIYDRTEKRIIISNRIGAGEISRKVVMHELTHYLEGSKGYDEYKEAVLKASYLHDDADGTQRAADEDRIRRTYAESGVTLDEAGVESELVAEATEKIISDRDGRLTRQLLDQQQQGLLFRLTTKIGQFLAKRKAAKEGRLEEYEAIQAAYDRLKAALKEGAGNAANADPTVDLDSAARRRGDVANMGADGQMQFSLLGRTEDGKGIYASNFAPGTPKQVKIDRLVDLWQNVWSKRPIELEVLGENGQTRTITANFDPNYDPSNEVMTDLGKVVHNKNGSSGDRTITLNLADDLYDMAREVMRVDDEGESGKKTPTHEGVKRWHYFSNDFVYRDENGDKPMTLWLDLKEKEDGGYVYQLYAKKTKQKKDDHLRSPDGSRGRSEMTSSQPRELSSARQEESSFDTSVAENAADVNTQSTQNDVKYSLAPNQFGNKTAQGLETIDAAVKEILAGSKHEVIGEQERLETAWAAVNSRGVETVVDELLSMPAESWGAQENVHAALCAVLANRDGNLTTAAAILTRYDREGSKQGQTLQSRQLIGKLTPEGAIMEMVRKADKSNSKKGIPPGSFPTGEGAPKKGGNKTREDGSIERVAPEVQEVYHAADELKAMLDTLPGKVSTNNPWSLPLSDKQMRLIDQYKLRREKLPGIHYNVATKKQRMLAAIIANDPAMQGGGMTALCQQLEAIDKGYAVVTAADLHYTSSQMAQFRAKEGPDALVPKTQEGREALGRAFQAQDNVTQASLMKKWTAGRYANMLSASATAVRNIAGNVIAGGMESAATRVAEGIDKRVSRKTGTRTTATATRAERKTANAAFAAETARTVSDYFIAKVDTGHGRKYDVGGQGRVFQNEFLETYRNMVDFAMQIGDRPFYEQKYAEELAIIQRLGMKKNEMKDGKMITRDMTQEEMHEEATMRALHRVFQEDEAITGAINSIRGKNPLADLAVTVLIPFTKTPMNVAMRAVEYSPVGLIATAARRAVFGLDSGKAFSISQRDYVMGLGRGLTGTGLCVMGYMLAAAGIILTGREEEDNANVREVKKALGEPYGMYMKIGDQMREIDWAMPIASALAVGAEFYNALEDGEGFGDAALTAITASVGGQIMDTPMLSAMNDIFRGYDETEDVIDRVLKTAGTSLINQTFSPSIIRAIAKATDPYVRDTSSQSGLMSTLNSSVIQYWPGLRQMLPKATDMTGDYMLQSGYYSWGKEKQNAALHFLDSFFTPTATIGEKNDDALFELLDLSYRTGETAFLPKDMVDDDGEVTVLKSLANATKTGESGYTLTLTDEERREFNRLYGDILFNGLRGVSYEKPRGFDDRHADVPMNGIRNLMESREWARLSDEDRVKIIANMKAAVRELVTYRAINGDL